MPKYLSNRIKRTPLSGLTSDRYSYLGLGQAEPDLGDPIIGPSSTGAKPIKPGNQYIVVGVEGYPGERFWIPNQGGLIPGSISVFDETTLVGGLSSTTQLVFKGAAIKAEGEEGPPAGIGVTITVFSPGNDGELLFNTANDFSTNSKLRFDTSIGRLSAGDRLIVGSGGTVITTTGVGSVGIGTTNPTQELHVQGDLRLTGTVYDYLNQPGNPDEILVKNNFGGLTWVSQNTIRSGAGGAYQDVQFHNSAGLVDGAPNFVYDEVNQRVGIGSTKPTVLLDVLGTSKFTGQTQIDKLNVTGVATIATLGVTGTTTTRNLLVTGISTLGIVTATSGYFTGVVTASKFVGSVDITDLYVTGIATIGTLKVGGLTTTRDLTVYESTNLNRLKVTGISTFDSQVNVNNLNVTGVGTFDNIKLDTNTVSTNVGNLIIDSSGGTTQINDAVYINDTTSSTSKDTGSLIIEGGVGIEKELYVGGVIGVTSTLKDFYGNVGLGGSILISTGIGVSWVTPYAAGLQGAQGTQGIQGIQGTQGAQGRQGTQGTGTQGVQGSAGTGTQGAQGRQGTQGSAGTGTQGTQGVQGSAGTGTQGTQGVQGSQGTQGVKGDTGTGSTDSILAKNTTTITALYPVMVGNVGVATTAWVSTTKLSFDASSGQITAIDFNSTSDKNLKTNIQTLSNSIEILNKINPVKFNWVDTGKLSYGLIAQELENILPELVKENDGVKSVSYIPLIALLISSVQKLQIEIDELKKTDSFINTKKS